MGTAEVLGAFHCCRGTTKELSSATFDGVIRSWGMRATYFILVPLVAFLLAIPHAAYAQGVDDAAALIQQVNELRSQGRYSEAVPLAQSALAIQEKALGPDHPYVAVSLNDLGVLYYNQGRYTDAETLYKRSLQI